MRFDNKQFENNVQTSLSTLDRLKKNLNLEGATKGLENVDAASKKLNFSGLSSAVETVQAKFSAFEVMAVTALANITNSAINASVVTINYVKKTTKSPQQCGIGLVKNRYQSLDLYLKINKYSKNPYKKLLS